MRLHPASLKWTPGLDHQGMNAERLEQLHKPDDRLLAVIAGGLDGKARPAFGQVLSPDERRDVLAFLREAFGARL